MVEQHNVILKREVVTNFGIKCNEVTKMMIKDAGERLFVGPKSTRL